MTMHKGYSGHACTLSLPEWVAKLFMFVVKPELEGKYIVTTATEEERARVIQRSRDKDGVLQLGKLAMSEADAIALGAEGGVYVEVVRGRGRVLDLETYRIVVREIACQEGGLAILARQVGLGNIGHGRQGELELELAVHLDNAQSACGQGGEARREVAQGRRSACTILCACIGARARAQGGHHEDSRAGA